MKIAAFPVPNLHILGFQKCGTTAMAHFLSQHPDICQVQGKEAHVFDDPEYANAPDKEAFAMQKYRDKLRHFNQQQYILDSTPITLFHPQFTQACVTFNPQAKFIVMKRDPVERAFSHYQMTKARGLESRSPFMAFLLEPWRMRGRDKKLPLCSFEHSYRDHSYLSRGLYKRQLDMLYKQVDSKQVLIVEQTALASDHENTLKRVWEFLSIDPVSVIKEDIFSSADKKESSVAARIVAKLYFSLNW